MKAAQINEYGNASVIKIVNTDKPAVAEGQVLVEVHAAGLNPVDTSIREGHMQQMAPLEFPVTLGGDIAGVVAEVADGVEDIAVGDKVYGQSLALSGGSGAFAEFATAKPEQIAKIPANLDFQQAASLPLTAASALQALTQHMDLQSGQKLFVHGGSGGIGTIAIQAAKAMGAYVATTATGDGVELVKSLGADEVIDYKAEDFTDKVKDFDAALSLVFGDDNNKVLNVLKPGGVCVSLVGQPDEALAEKLGIKTVAQFTQVTSDVLNALNEMVEAGQVRPQVDKVYSLDDIVKAFEDRENNSVKGKVVVSIKD